MRKRLRKSKRASEREGESGGESDWVGGFLREEGSMSIRR